jgi:hypothetical protein
MLGKYVNTGYIYTNFTSIPTNHYQLIIRFSIAYIGTWIAPANLQLNANFGLWTDVAFNIPYACTNF